ncbi:MAG: phenylacetate--CoA ligase [Ruminococcus sp.]|jgi:phenylacetate-CoA ligase|nr:phenylacetate--CoA ligase [Ruminococcus sp.]
MSSVFSQAETMSRKEIEVIQLLKLKKEIDYCIANNAEYGKRLGEAGVTSDKIKDISDIKYLPFITKKDMHSTYPFGFFGQPMNKIVRIHASSGTTGKPTVIGYTQRDLDDWAECMARLCFAGGARESDIFQICFGYGLFTGALGLHYALEKIGATVIPSSSGNTEKQMMLMQDFGTTGLVSTPSYAEYIGELAREQGITENLKLRLGLLGSEGCTPEMRNHIESALHIFVTDNYGMSELGGPGVSGECEERDGMHINEDFYLCEIIDPITGEVLPEGSQGELVVTTLAKEGFPMLRYRTGDITKLVKEPCKCGRTFARMDKIKGRSDDMLKIRGVNVFPSQIESVLMTYPQIAPHYQLVVTRKNYSDRLEVRVEISDVSLLENFAKLEELQENIKSKLKTILGIDTAVSLVEPKTLERFQGKAKRILDLRNQ